MTDRPEFLDDLEQQLLDGLPQARRRRQQRRAALVGVGALLLVGGVAWAVAAQGGSDDREQIATESTTSGVPASTSTVPSASTTSSEPPLATTGPLRLMVDAVSAGPEGVVLRRADDPENLVVVADQPAERAVVFESGVVAYQRVDDPAITVWTPDASREQIEAEPGWSLTLLDAASIDGADTLLITTSLAQPAGPEDAEKRLQLVSLDTGAGRDLGVVGGWESGVLQGLLTPDAAVTLHSGEGWRWMRGSSYDGLLLWQTEPSFDGDDDLIGAVAADRDGRTWSLTTSFVGDDFTPALDSVSRDPITGDEIGTAELIVELAGTATGDGFCLNADLRSGTLLCDRSGGTPVAIDLTTGTSVLIDGFESGVVTTVAPIFEDESGPTPPSTTIPECVDEPSPPNEVLVIGDFDVDFDGTTELSLVGYQDGDEWLVQGLLPGRGSTAPTSLGDLNADFAQAAGSVDLDEDGLGELVLGGFGNTARTVVFLTFDGCDLHLVTDGATDLPFKPTIGAGGNSCAPTGCWFRTRCIDRTEGRILEITDVGPVARDFENLPPPEEVEMRVHTNEYQLDGSTMTVVGESEALYDGTDELPAGTPTAADSDRIQC